MWAVDTPAPFVPFVASRHTPDQFPARSAPCKVPPQVQCDISGIPSSCELTGILLQQRQKLATAHFTVLRTIGPPSDNVSQAIHSSSTPCVLEDRFVI
jgi:hypothetical protein